MLRIRTPKSGSRAVTCGRDSSTSSSLSLVAYTNLLPSLNRSSPSHSLLLSLAVLATTAVHKGNASQHSSYTELEPSMALSSKASSSPALPDWAASSSRARSVPNSPQHCLQTTTNIHGNDHGKQSKGHHEAARLSFSRSVCWNMCRRPVGYIIHRGSTVFCRSMRTQRSGSTEDVRHTGDCSNASRESDDRENIRAVLSQETIDTTYGIARACKYVYNDAKYVNERARSDIVLLSRGILSLDARARQDVAILGSKFLKLDARAREDTEKIIDVNVKTKAERLNHIAKILKEKAESRLKEKADRHWSDGALEADLRRADYLAKRRAMEDTLMALEFVKDIHDIMVSKMYDFPLRRKDGQDSSNIGLEKNGRSLAQFPGEVSSDRIHALEEAYWSMASALSEADGIDYTNPEELELLVATLIDLDAMDGKSSVSLLAECSSSPDVNTRQALANALATAPSMWTLGNAGMGALQRLAEDSNPAVAAAASKAINELKRQWEIEEGDNWRFTLDPNTIMGRDALEDSDEEV